MPTHGVVAISIRGFQRLSREGGAWAGTSLQNLEFSGSPEKNCAMFVKKCLDAGGNSLAYARKGSGGACPSRKNREFSAHNAGQWMWGESRIANVVSCHGAGHHRGVKQVKG